MFGTSVPSVSTARGEAAADAATTSAVTASQNNIIADVWGVAATARGSKAVPELTRFQFTPGFGAEVDATTLAALANHPDVIAINEDGLDKPSLTTSVGIVQGPQAWAFGATGATYSVAILDSGVRRSHEFFTGRYLAAACFNTRDTTYASFSLCPGGVNTNTTSPLAANDCNPATINGCGHGTHVGGTAVGTNTARQASEPAYGVARSARIVAVNVFTRFTTQQYCGSSIKSQGCILAFTSDQIEALEFVYARRNVYKVASVNMSLGGGRYTSYCTTDSRRAIITALRNARVATVIAAGNDGYDGAVGAPGCIPEAVTVAAAIKNGFLPGFTNWATMVDLIAPGVSIRAPYPSGTSNTFYASLSGTSMATPHVAGAFAAIRTKRPLSSVTVVENALKNTGRAITYFGFTRKEIRIRNAINQIPN
jgi:serine protease